MDRAARVRWGLLFSALVATTAASVWPDGEGIVTRPHAAPVVPVRTVPGPVAGVAEDQQPDWVASEENPFATRMWVAPPPPAPTAEVRTVAAVVASEPPPTPPLPFRFLGQMVDGADRVIYLGAGEQVLLARAGEVLEGGYKVLAITQAQIEFESTASGVRQSMPLPAQEP